MIETIPQADPALDPGIKDPVLEIESLSLWYGEKQALNEISLKIPEKKITAFIGPSGCGKSTLLRCINRLNDLIDGVRTEGDIRFEGRSIFDPRMDVNALRKRIGMVFQKSNPFPKSIYENVAYGCAHPGDQPQARPRRNRRAEPARRRALGRGQGPSGRQRPRHVRRPAAAPVHRPRHRRRAGGDPARRALLGARPDRHGPDRRADAGAQRLNTPWSS